MTAPHDPRDDAARDLEEELRFHRQETLSELQRQGLTEDQALRAAVRRFGDEDTWRRRILRVSSGTSRVPRLRTSLARALTALGRDVKFGARALWRTPLFTVCGAAVFALLVSATTVVLALLNGVLLAPMPYPDPERLAYIWGRNSNVRAGFRDLPVSEPDLADWRDRASHFVAIGGVVPEPMTLTGAAGDPERLGSVAVLGDLFAAIGTRPLLGRTVTPADTAAGAPPVVVLGYALWQRRFSADPTVVGRSVTLDGRPYEVIGVMPAGFAFPRVEEISPNYGFPRDVTAYVPWRTGGAGPPTRGNRYIVAAARLGTHSTITQADKQLSTIAAEAAAENLSAMSGQSFAVVPFKEQAVATVRRSLMLLAGAVLALLAIGCLNVTHLLLVRASHRRREFAVRMSLGAGRLAIARQILVETVLLATLGGSVGIAVGSLALLGLGAIAPSDVPRLDMVHLNARVAGLSLLVILVASLIVSLVVTFSLKRSAVERDLQHTARVHSVRVRSGPLLVGAEVALSVLLVVVAGLLVRSFIRVVTTAPGFEVSNTLSFRIALPAVRYPSVGDLRRTYDVMLEALEAIPGVTHAAYTWQLPMSGTKGSTGYLKENQESAMALIHRVSVGYFDAMGMHLVRGCGLDCPTDLPPVVVNQALERVQWPGTDPIGQIITVNTLRSRIVGIVSDVRHGSLEENPAPELYQQGWLRSMYVVVRGTPATPPDLLASVRRAVASIDASLPLSDVRTLEQRLASTTARRRFTLAGMAVFAGLATGLAVIGLYGVTALLVTHVRRELGIRMALGATSAGAVGLLMRRSAAIILGGVVVGTFAALGAARYVRSFLFEISPTDPATYLVVAGGLTIVAVLATLVPASRAASVNPIQVLRED